MPTRHPVLRYLAVVRSARDLGMATGALDPLALRFHPTDGSVDAIADAAASELLGGDGWRLQEKDLHPLG